MMGPLAILGPGSLGVSLARWASACGIRVHLAGRGLEHVESRLASLGEERTTIIPCGSMAEALEGAWAVLEAVPEDLDLKARIWADLDRMAATDTLRLTGSSCLPVRSIREASGMAGTLLGFHLFVPVHRMRIVELACEPSTPEPLRFRAQALGQALGLKVVHVRDQAGYASARMALVQGLETMRLLEQGVATAEDLDALMVSGYGHPAGPLELSDRIGLDLRLAIARQLFQATGEGRFKPPKILEDLVARGHLGRKTGRGFYPWNTEGVRI